MSSGRAREVREILAELKQLGSARVREQMKNQFGIVAPKAFGVKMGAIQLLAKKLGRDHELAAALWETGWYEARLLTAYVDDPEEVTSAQMDKWARDFDNWGVCDTLCFALFDRTQHAWKKVTQWSTKEHEFVKRAAFATLAGLSLHDKEAPDEPFVRSLKLIERAAKDDRNFVKKGVSWALRVMGRRNPALNRRALAVAKNLAESDHPAARWIGRDASRELASSAVQKRLAKKALASR